MSEKQIKQRGPNRFRENDVARGVRSVIKGGGTVKRVIIGQDNVTIECGEQDAAPHGNELDQWMEKHACKVQGAKLDDEAAR
jgi:hypothetical protein